MANVLQEGSSWLVGQNRRYMAGLVTYSRPGSTPLAVGPIPAKLGKTPYETVDASGVVTTVESRDFLIEAADLVLGGAAVEPARGDRITDAVGQVWEVALGPGQQCFRRVEFDTVFRIHTKHVE
jgi:hypothetical protein